MKTDIVTLIWSKRRNRDRIPREGSRFNGVAAHCWKIGRRGEVTSVNH